MQGLRPGWFMNANWKNMVRLVLCTLEMSYMRESGILCKKNVERWSFNCGLWAPHVLGRI